MDGTNEYQLIFNFFELEGVPIHPDARKKMFYESVKELGVIHVQTEDGGYFVAQVIGVKATGLKGIKILEDMDVQDSMKIRQVLEAMDAEDSLQNLLNMKDEHSNEENR